MSDVLEGKKETYDSNTRILYVPPGVNYEDMFNHGVKLFRLGYSVWVHEHRMSDTCASVTPDGVVRRCGQLTAGGQGATLVPVSKTGGSDN